MAATFSYAQAAKGQAPIPKSVPRTPPTNSGTFSELGPDGNWAEDIESTTGDKVSHAQESHEPPPRPAQPKDVVVERTKTENTSPQVPSDMSSPDLAASASTIPDDLSSNPPGASSDSTWDAKSQVSEPAWIAERKERQGNEGTARSSKKGSKEPSPAPTPRMLQDAPPPAVNPWAKRAEDAKVRSSAPISHAITSAPASNNPSDARENPASKNVQTKKTDAFPQAPGADAKKTGGPNGLRIHDSRANSKQAARSTVDDARGENAPLGRNAPRETKNTPPLPPSSDQSLWPTPDTAQDKKPKEAATAPEKNDGDVPDADASQGVKAQKKNWQPLPVTPNILWATPEMNRPPRGVGEKGSRSGNATRARGAFRGGANGPKGGDRNGAKTSPDKESSPRGHQALADREAMPPPSRPVRAQSADQSRDPNARPGYESKTQTSSATTKVTGSTAAGTTSAFHTHSVGEAIYSNGQTPAKVPPFVPGARSGSAHAWESGDATGGARENPSHRSAAGEGKKDGRSYEGFGSEWKGPHRGGKRGGRGRGGGREFANSHQPGNLFPPGYTEFLPYGVPPSPSGFTPSRGNNAFGHQQQGRGSWPRGTTRAQSIPLDNTYGARYAYPQMPPMPGFMPQPYEQYPYGAPASPFVPGVDLQMVIPMVSTQIEYYFSTDNLIHDIYLRKNMDGKGFVFLETIANFNRIKNLSVDKDIIRAACLRSESVEIRVGDDNKERLRRREGWEKYVLPVEQRDASVQNDGPAQLQQPDLPQHLVGGAPNYRGPPFAASQSRRSYDHTSFVPMNMQQVPYGPYAPMFDPNYPDMVNGEELRGRTPKSPMREQGLASAHEAAISGLAEEKDPEPDVCPDDQMSALTVVVKQNHGRLPHHTASRTFSNGSIDTRAVFGADGEKSADEPAEDHSLSVAAAGPPANGGDSKRNESRSRPGRSPDGDAGVPKITLMWVRDKEIPASSLPEDADLVPYLSLRVKALEQRSQAATGQCPYDLDVLYQFWSHFLIRNFNGKMYGEFKYFAHDDVKQRASLTGVQNLVQFYAKALSSPNPIRDRILRDYVQLVKDEPAGLEGHAYKQLRSAWRNGALNLKNRKKLTDIVDDGLRERLES